MQHHYIDGIEMRHCIKDILIRYLKLDFAKAFLGDMNIWGCKLEFPAVMLPLWK